MIGVIVQSSSAHTAKRSGAAAMSRAGSANRTWVQIHLGEEPADAGGTREFVSLPHPRTGKDCRYMLRGESVLELQMAKPPEGRGSWFIGDLVKQDGSVQLVSEIDPIFLVAPLLATHANKRVRAPPSVDVAPSSLIAAATALASALAGQR